MPKKAFIVLCFLISEVITFPFRGFPYGNRGADGNPQNPHFPGYQANPRFQALHFPFATPFGMSPSYSGMLPQFPPMFKAPSFVEPAFDVCFASVAAEELKEQNVELLQLPAQFVSLLDYRKQNCSGGINSSLMLSLRYDECVVEKLANGSLRHYWSQRIQSDESMSRDAKLQHFMEEYHACLLTMFNLNDDSSEEKEDEQTAVSPVSPSAPPPTSFSSTISSLTPSTSPSTQSLTPLVGSTQANPELNKDSEDIVTSSSPSTKATPVTSTITPITNNPSTVLFSISQSTSKPPTEYLSTPTKSLSAITTATPSSNENVRSTSAQPFNLISTSTISPMAEERTEESNDTSDSSAQETSEERTEVPQVTEVSTPATTTSRIHEESDIVIA